jgi:hypothetical protein
MIQPNKSEPTPIRSELGVPGLTHFGGYINDEWDRRLKRTKDELDQIQQMIDDPTVSAGLSALDSLMRTTDYEIEPGVDPNDDAVKLIKTALTEMDDSWESTLSEILTFIPYGFSLFEIVYALRDGEDGRSTDGKIGWKRWSPRSQDTIVKWEWDAEGRDVLAAIQYAPPNYHDVTLPMDRCLHFRTKNRRQSPKGKSLIRPAFNAYYNKKHIERIEGIGVERDMSGMAHMEIPESAYNDSTSLSGWQALVQNIRSDQQAGLVTPLIYDENGNQLYKFSLVSTGGQRAIDTNAIIARYERQILRVLMTDWLTLGDMGGGSFALGVSKSEMFMQFAQGLLDTIADTITNQAIRPLCLRNGFGVDQVPVMRFASVSKRDMGKFVAAFQQAASTGALDTEDPEVRRALYQELGLPIPEEGFDEPEPPQPMPPAMVAQQQTPPVPSDATQGPQDAQQAGKRPVGQAQAFTEHVSPDLIERAMRRFQTVVGPDYAGMISAKVE